MMRESARSLAFFERRFNGLLQAHDVEFTERISPFVNGDPDATDKLSQIVHEISEVITAASRITPSCNRDIAALLRMAMVDLGIEADGERPGHAAFRTALEALERPRH